MDRRKAGTDCRLSRREFVRAAAVLGGLAGLRPAVGWAAASSKPASRPAERWRIGCSTRPWEQHEYRVALDGIAEAGYRYVGLMTAKVRGLILSAESTDEQVQEVREELGRRRLGVVTVYGGGIAVSKSLKAGIEELNRLIDRAAAVRSESLMLGGTGEEKLYEDYYKAVAECCDRAAAKKVMLVLKPHGGLNTTGPQCRKAIEKVGHRNFRLWYDAGNILFYTSGELDPVQDSTTVDGLVAGWCIKDYQHPKEVFVNPGEGRVDFKGVFANLRKGGFTHGPLMVETVGRGDVVEVVANARKARLFVERLVAEGGGQSPS